MDVFTTALDPQISRTVTKFDVSIDAQATSVRALSARAQLRVLVTITPRSLT